MINPDISYGEDLRPTSEGQKISEVRFGVDLPHRPKPVPAVLAGIPEIDHIVGEGALSLDRMPCPRRRAGQHVGRRRGDDRPVLAWKRAASW